MIRGQLKRDLLEKDMEMVRGNMVISFWGSKGSLRRRRGAKCVI